MKPALFQITLKAFVVRDQRLLVLRDRIQQSGDLPGGRLAAGEIYQPWSKALQREIEEELGPGFAIDLGAEPIFLFPHFIEESGYEALGIAFLGQHREGEPELSAEHDRFDWRDLNQYDPAQDFRGPMVQAVLRFQDSGLWRNAGPIQSSDSKARAF